ncbi:hypothetical protein CRUP_028294 [Coryphaenoides rupestris]|nr:hypothetical protein CRUP_028294 [Coryphaenoides rupestris]
MKLLLFSTLLTVCSGVSTVYRSPLNDFQRSEGRELVPTSWNSARVLIQPALNVEDCATRCSLSLDCRWTPSTTNGLELNYCRNPDGDRIGPWCYTTDPERRYESCNIPHCKDEVCITCNGEEYRGQVDHTVSGRECQRWDQQHPQQHIYQPEKYPDKSLDDNYCRNPDASPVPWCYTTDQGVERESCEISKCSVVPQKRQRSSYTTNCFRGRGEDYRGRVNETTSGIPCQRWDAQGLEENYCRNPDGSEAPWCFTSVPEMRTALCLQIKRCADDIEAEDCYHENGRNYKGMVRKTRKGITCQKWNVNTPHRTKINSSTHPDGNLTENYCRNPDGDQHGPWCYTTDSKTEFDYCAIKHCEEPKFSECGKRDDRLPEASHRLRIINGRETISVVDRWWTQDGYVDLPGYSAKMGTLFKDPQEGEPGVQTIPLTKIVCGPSESQLVMLQLESPVQINERISQICLPPERFIVPEGTYCEIAGWGETKGTGDETVLNVAHIPVLGNRECNKYFRGRVRDNEMCTSSFQGGVGACERDYGGPLACQNSDCWVLEGVIIPMRRCGHPGQPNIFIRVSVYVDWIKKVMGMT